MNKIIIYFLLLFAFVLNTWSEDNVPYTILISLDGLRYDFDTQDTLMNFDYIKKNGVKAKSLKPSFPTLSLPNLFSLLSGLYPINHGIIANTFKDPYYNDFFTSRIKGSQGQNKWYIGETFWETAKRLSVKTADINSIFPKVNDTNKNADYYLEFNSEISYYQRIDEGLSYLSKVYNERPKFIHFYFEEIDMKSHLYGTNSQEVKLSYRFIDSLIGYIFTKLNSLNLNDSTNIIVVSEHGAIDIDSNQTVNLDNILSGIRYELQNYGTFAMIDGRRSVLQEIYDSLKIHSINYEVYFRKDLPKYLNFSNHPYISPIVILAKPGWVFIDNTTENRQIALKSVSGYDNNILGMHGVFFAIGPSFQKGIEVETIEIIDIYPILCFITGIMPRNNIDGNLVRVKHILN